MDSNRLLTNINESTRKMMRKYNVDYILGYNGVHLGAISFRELSLPIIECEDDFFIPDRKTFRAYRRRAVFGSGKVVYKTGELSSDPNFHKPDNIYASSITAKSNLNLLSEISDSLDHPEFIHPVLFLVHDIPNELLYIAQPKALTLQRALRNPSVDSINPHKLETAADSFYQKLEDKGLVFVPRIKSNGRIDLGDILLTKDESRKISIKVTDHPTILPKNQTEMDNSHSLTSVVSAMMHTLRHR